MRKRISFFNVIYIVTISISSLLFVIFLVTAIISYFSLNHRNEVIYYDTNIEIYNPNDIKRFNAYYNDTDLFILISVYTEKKDSYLLNYAYYYHQKYQCPIYLEVDNVNNIKYVTITIDSVAAIN